MTFAGRATAAQIALTSSLQGGFAFALGPFVGRITDGFGPRITVLIGVTLQVLANLAASFTVENLGGIYATQGILFGIGTCFVTNGAISEPAQWFSKRLSLAFGLSTTLGGVGALCFTFGTSAMLNVLGPAWTLRIYAIFNAGLLYPAALCLKPRGKRIAPDPDAPRRPFVNFKLFLDPKFSLMFVGIFLVCMAFPTPFYLPSHAYEVQLPPQTGTTLLAIMTGMSAVSTAVAGALVPYTGVMNIFVMTQFLAAASIFFFWVAAGSSIALLSTYAAVYGLSWGSFWNLVASSTAELFFHLDVFPGMYRT